MTNEAKMDIYMPTGPCDTCARDNLTRNPDTGLVRVYCGHNKAGGVYNPKTERWTLVSPVTPTEFDVWCTERQNVKRNLMGMASAMADEGQARH